MEQALQGCAERLDHRDSAAGEGDRPSAANGGGSYGRLLSGWEKDRERQD